MHRIQSSWLPLVFLSFVSCGSASPPREIEPAQIQDSQPKSKIAQAGGGADLAFALSIEVIGMNPAYLEQKIGVPVRSSEYQAVFEVSGCKIEYGIDGGEIFDYRVDVSEGCRPVISGKIISPQTTFSEVHERWGTYIADCFAGCGNAYDPSISLRFDGSRSNGFVSVTYGASYEDTSEAQDIWETEVRRRLGIGPYEDPVDLDAMTCVKNPSERVVGSLATVKISYVHVFSNVDDIYC